MLSDSSCSPSGCAGRLIYMPRFRPRFHARRIRDGIIKLYFNKEIPSWMELADATPVCEWLMLSPEQDFRLAQRDRWKTREVMVLFRLWCSLGEYYVYYRAVIKEGWGGQPYRPNYTAERVENERCHLPGHNVQSWISLSESWWTYPTESIVGHLQYLEPILGDERSWLSLPTEE